jgi:hypothetical protein
VARQPSEKDSAKSTNVDVDSTEPVDDAIDIDDDDERSAATVALWSEVRVEPVEIALPRGTGYTLRAYRMSDTLQAVELRDDEDPEFAILKGRTRDEIESDEDGELDDLDDDLEDSVDAVEDDDVIDVDDARRRRRRQRDEDGEDAEEDAELDEAAAAEDEFDEDAEEDEEDDEDDEEAGPEEVPVFLGQDGKLLLFRTPEELVRFVKSDAEHYLVQLDTWADLQRRVRAEDIVPLSENRYELDLVVENLRGGHDAWDTELLLEAGEVARDLGYALRKSAIVAALSPGSPLDDLDEALRATASGGVGGFFARRRLRKIGAQQAALGWRTIIGKISAAVDWRD